MNTQSVSLSFPAMSRFRYRFARSSGLAVFVILLFFGPVLGVLVAIGVGFGWPSKPPVTWWPGWLWIGDRARAWTLDQRLAGLGADAAFAVLYEACVVGIIAVVAYALASERPRLKIELRGRPSRQDSVTFVYDDRAHGERREVVQVDDLLLLTIRLYNRRQFSARNPAVRVQLIGFEGETQVTGTWLRMDPILPGATHAWQWNGVVDDTIHGPMWFRDTQVLDLRPPQPGQGLSGRPGVTHAIHIEAVAEGDHVTRKYIVDWKTPAQWVRGDRERDELLPPELRYLR